MSSPSRGDPALARELAEQGLRATRQRMALLRLLRCAEHHPTVIELHDLLRAEQKRVSRKTVYEILDSFVRAGLASCPTGGGEPSRYEANSAPHDHARCRLCGCLFDLPLSPRRRSRLRAPRGFRVEGVSVLVRGVCGRCVRAMR
jgi:Fur family transcriptional regulator, peroxide stress response regulator